MSMNNALNGVLAIIENRPDIARTLFRDPNSDIVDASAVVSRIYEAIDKKMANELRSLLITILTIQSPEEEYGCKEEEAFYAGVRAVEDLLAKYVEKLEE